MDEPLEPKMTPFDRMINDDRLQLLKAVIPYAPFPMQVTLSVFAKVQELQHVMAFSQKRPSLSMMSKEVEPSLLEMLQDIGQYAGPNVKETFDSITLALSMMEMLQAQQSPEFTQEVDLQKREENQ